MHIARTGDDTSGRRWERTRKMGINTLAFRLGQHRTFFDIDADWVGVTGEIPWELNRAWAELLSRSGTPFFASIQPDVLTSKQSAEMKGFFAAASVQESGIEPIGEQYSTAPDCWRTENGEKLTFNWYELDGATPDFL
jgi:alpha-galactosidase